MRIEAIITKISLLLIGTVDVLASELSHHVQYAPPDNGGHVPVRYTAANSLLVIGATKEDKQCISEILQETWESADGWFVGEQHVVIFVFVGSPWPFYFIYKL